jgi:hypothetical protein
MFCTQCGTQVSDGVKFCPSCGNNVRADAAASKASPDSGAQTSSAAEPRLHPAHAPEPIPLRADAQTSARASAIALIVAAAGYWTWSNFAPRSGGGSPDPAANVVQRDANVVPAPAPGGANQPDARAIAAPAPGGVNQADAKVAAAPAPGGANQPDATVVAAAAPGAVAQRDAGVGSARDSGEQAEIAAARAALDREIAAEESEARERASRSASKAAPSSRAKPRQ